jgi:hypothetical protein
MATPFRLPGPFGVLTDDLRGRARPLPGDRGPLVQSLGGWSSGTVRLQSHSRFIPGASGEEAPASPPARQEAEPASVKRTQLAGFPRFTRLSRPPNDRAPRMMDGFRCATSEDLGGY